MSFIKNLKFKFAKITNRADKKWPVHARIHEARGLENLEEADDLEDLNTQIRYDRGRTHLKDNGEQELELLNHGNTGIEVGYEYFKNRKDGKEEIELLKPDRNTFIPLGETISGESEEDVSVEKIHDIRNWKLWAEREYDEKTSVVEVNDEAWYESPVVQGLIVFIGAGIFFTMLSIGIVKVQKQAAKNVLPLVLIWGKSKVSL